MKLKTNYPASPSVPQGCQSRWLTAAVCMVLFFSFCSAIYMAARAHVVEKAEKEIQDMLLQHRSVHLYIQRNIHPEICRLKDAGEIPQGFYSPVLLSSSYMVRNIHNYLNEERKKAGRDLLYYKMAAENPRNPMNEADLKEQQLLRMFNENRDITEYRDVVEIGGRSYLQMALPFLTTNRACLKCHGRREDAPSQLQDMYKGMGGFGDKEGNIRAIESIRVPLDKRLTMANIVLIAASLVGLGFMALFGFNYRLRAMVAIQTEKLRESEERFRAAFNSAKDCILIWDKDYNHLYANQSAIDHIGTGSDKVVDKNIRDSLGHDPDFMRVWMRRVDQVFETGKVLRVQDRQEIQGCPYFTDSILYPIRDMNGGVVSVCVVYRDITELKHAEEEIRHLRNYLSNIIDSMPSVLIGVDADGKVTRWNKTAEQTTGTRADAAQGRLLSDVFPRMASEMGKISKSIRTRETKQERKIPRMSENGLCYEDVTIYPLIDNGSEGAVIRIDDVTEKVRMEEMMVQSEKMLSVGGLAAGMAHEINNPLAVMMQTASVMANRLGGKMNMSANLEAAAAAGTSMEAIRNFMEAREIPRMLSAISESGGRMAAIVDNMLSFAQKSEARASSYTPDELLDKALDLAATDYDMKKLYDFRMIRIKREYEDNLPAVPCEGGNIRQVLLNILRNGAQAMQDAGTKAPLFVVRTRLEKDREMVRMEIEDNGPGMDEAIRKRVFEPFFTTKSVGVGTGLGMSVSYFIITENHGGEMAVESRAGSGAKFIICLPIGRRA